MQIPNRRLYARIGAGSCGACGNTLQNTVPAW